MATTNFRDGPNGMAMARGVYYRGGRLCTTRQWMEDHPEPRTPSSPREQDVSQTEVETEPHRDGCDPPEGFFFSEGYTDPEYEALLVYYRPGRPVHSERALVLDRVRRPLQGGRRLPMTMSVESFLPGGLIIRHHDQERMHDVEMELSTLFQVVRLPGRDGVPGTNAGALRRNAEPETREAITQTPRRLRHRAVNTDLVQATQPETSDATTEVEHAAPWRRDCATQAERLGTAKWTQTAPPRATSTKWSQTRAYQEGPVTRAQSRKAPLMADGSTAVEKDAPWRSETATQAQPAIVSVELQTSMCALQDRERSRVVAPTDAAAASQEKEEDGDAAEPPATPGSPGREEGHQDEASSPAEKKPQGRRRRRRRTRKQKATPAHHERTAQLQRRTAPRTAVSRGANQERTSAGSGSQEQQEWRSW
ncbi:transcription termination factor Rho isoform X2 [Anabrus simplex]|uniref:transcription termination factor Rho isoform X2 n=1 Tax=Anabrus simplex TaxID=316456 RepID=UPI0035A3703F